MRSNKLKLYVIIDPQHCVVAPRDVLSQCLDVGVRAFQLRDKRGEYDLIRSTAYDFARIAEIYDALFFVNDDAKLASEVGASGVHLGPNDASVESVRAAFPDLLIGRSCGSRSEVESAKTSGADYVGVGAIYEARSIKENASAPRGIKILREAATCAIPVVGIGGIDVARAQEVWNAGATGVAVIRAICGSENPAREARRFLGY